MRYILILLLISNTANAIDHIDMERCGFNVAYILAGNNTLSLQVTTQEVEVLYKFRLASDAIQSAIFALLNMTPDLVKNNKDINNGKI